MGTLDARFQLLLSVTFLLLGAATLPATIFSHLTGEGGVVDYNMAEDPANGWYTEPGSDYHFKLGFKQGARNSASPKIVATLRVTPAEHFKGDSAIELRITPYEEFRTLANGKRVQAGAAHKVAIASVKPSDAFSPSVMKPKDWYHGFAMKINPAEYVLPSDSVHPVLIEQWWQGSPFHPPVSLVIFNEAEARARGWSDANTNGNFGLVLRDDDHDSGGKASKGKAHNYNLGPVKTGQWLKWIIHVRPDPTGRDGAVDVSLDGVERLCLRHIVVGYDPRKFSSQQRPAKTFPYVDCCVYRGNGSSIQSIFLDEILFADSLSDVTNH